MNSLEATDDLWSESCRFYATNNVKSYLLELQNKSNKNINRLLFSLWFSHQQKRLLTSQEITTINNKTEKLECFITKLRQLRLNQNLISQTTRKKVLEIELRLEKVHQRNLVNSISLSNSIQFGSENKALNISLFKLNLEALSMNLTDNYHQLIHFWLDYKQ